MKKALVIMNGFLVNNYLIASAVNIAKASSSSLHAFFLTHDTTSPEFDYLFPNDLSLTQNNLTGKSIAEENAELVNAYIQLFIDTCKQNEVPYFIEQDTHFSLKQLINYTAFSDFLIADAHASLDRYRLSDLLTDAHCPVFLTSTPLDKIKRIIFTYDGSYSSIYAIKMYSYLFPEWSTIDTYLLHISLNADNRFPFEEKLKAWISRHYNNIKIELVSGNVQKSLVGFITSDSEDSLVVMGAYGRSNLSRIIHRSIADVVIEKTKASVFIVHE